MSKNQETTKIAIIGSGPSGLTAGIYTSRAQIDTIIFLGMQPGGQLTTTTEIENFPGAWDEKTKEGKMGADLMSLIQKQAEHFGAKTIFEQIKEVNVKSDSNISEQTTEVVANQNINQKQHILFATHNPSKIKRYKDFLNFSDMQIVSAADLSLEISEITENGKNEWENAKIKAKAYFENAKQNQKNISAALSLDTGIYFENLGPDEQPKKDVQRIAGVLESDSDEIRYTKMTDFYIKLAQKYKGKLKGYFLDVYCLFDGKNYQKTEAKREIVLTDKVNKKDVHFPICSLYEVNGIHYQNLNKEQLAEFLEPSLKAAKDLLKNLSSLNSSLSPKPSKNKFILKTTSDQEMEFDAVIVASGAEAKWLGIEGEEKFVGKGYHSCATCDGFFYRSKTIAVIGGGDSAMEESNFLTKFADKVYLIHRREEFRASKIMLERARNNPKIEFLLNKSPIGFLGEDKAKGLVLKDSKTGEISNLDLDGIFVAIGHKPNSDFVKGVLTTDQAGYLMPRSKLLPSKIATDISDKTKELEKWQTWAKFGTMSEIDGIFVAGDVEDTIYRQAITAAADGCKAAMDCEKWLESLE
jgi:thioredoxin reductase